MPRAKTDPAKLILRGAFRKDRHSEPTPALAPSEAPECPTWLSPGAAGYWPGIIADLATAGNVAAVDATVIGTLCEALHTYIELRDTPAPHVHLTPSGERAHPIQKLRRDALADLLAVAREVGMTPQARKGLPTTPAPKGPAPHPLFAKG